MGAILYKVQKHIKHMEGFANAILSHAGEIKKLQAECPHEKWSFSFQSNAHHQTLWHVIYQCNECGLQREEKKTPVCDVCDLPLVSAAKDDAEAEAERIKPEHGGRWNPPLVFRCSGCKKIHILWHRGD